MSKINKENIHLFKMNTNNLSNKQYKQLLESIEKLIDKRLNIEENKIILKQYGIYDIVYTSINETHTWNEEDGEDLEELKFIMGRLRYVIPSLMKTLIKKGFKKAVLLCVHSAKSAYKLGKDNSDICKNLFYALLFFAIGYGGNALKDKYNSNPTIPDTQIEYKDSTLIIKQTNDSIVVVKQNDSESAPEIKIVDKKSQSNSSIAVWELEMKNQNRLVTMEPPLQSNLLIYSLPIHTLQKNESHITRYEPSDDLVKALAEVEHFVNHLYDAANPNKKLTQKDLLNPKADITIGIGHQVKDIKERKKWFGKTISYEDALKMYKKDLSEHTNIVNNKMKQLPYYSECNFSQGFVDFLISVSYNCGAGLIYGNQTRPMSTFWNRMNNIRVDKTGSHIKEDIDYALASINQLLTGTSKQKGLKYRRRAEYWIAVQPYGTIKPEIYHLISPEYR